MIFFLYYLTAGAVFTAALFHAPAIREMTDRWDAEDDQGESTRATAFLVVIAIVLVWPFLASALLVSTVRAVAAALRQFWR